eukprot:550398_1
MQKLNLVHLIAGFHHLTMLKNLQQWSRMNRSLFWWCLVFCVIYECNALNNGVGVRPVMGFDTYNGFHGNYDSNFLEEIGRTLISSGLVNYGYNRVNIDGGWAYVIQNKTDQKYYTQRNATGFLYPGDPIKFPNGIDKTIKYIQSLGLKWGHYWNSGVNACGGAIDGGSENFMTQDISLFYSWNIDMIKVDDCGVEGNDTEIIFKWRDMLNATNRKVLFSDCHNQCENDPTKSNYSPWQPWCIDLANMWRVSRDIKANWERVLQNHDCTNGLGKWAQPGAWNDPDFLEVDIGDFSDDGTTKSLLMNQAHFSLWSIVSAPLILGNDLKNMSKKILDIITNKYAIDINQNYLNNAGDVITEFNISQQFRKQYEKQVKSNNNMTTLYYKPLPTNIGDAAILFLNRDNITSYKVFVDFNQLPLSNNNSEPLQCTVLNIWTNDSTQMTSFNATLPPQSVQYLKLDHCTIYV